MKSILIFSFLLCLLAGCKQHEASVPVLAESKIATLQSTDNSAVKQAFRDRKSNLFVEGSGVVKKLLPDDNKGSRHQKFLLTISDEQTLLFAHNIDLTEHVPLAVGDTIQFRGEYVFNPKGGVLHWTHHDPQGKIEGGWIKHDGKTYH